MIDKVQKLTEYLLRHPDLCKGWSYVSAELLAINIVKLLDE